MSGEAMAEDGLREASADALLDARFWSNRWMPERYGVEGLADEMRDSPALQGRVRNHQAIQRGRAEADLLSHANWEAGAVARLATDIAAHLHRALDGA